MAIPDAKRPTRIPTAAAMFEPYLEQAIRFLVPLRQPCGIEGEVIMPETVARLSADYDLRGFGPLESLILAGVADQESTSAVTLDARSGIARSNRVDG